MKSIFSKLIIGAAGLALAAAPLAADAQNWQSNNDHRGSYQQRSDDRRSDNRDRGHDRYRYGGGYVAPVYHRPYVNGYFGWAPGGFQGYYWNGHWYHHRRWNGGVWIYF